MNEENPSSYGNRNMILGAAVALIVIAGIFFVLSLKTKNKNQDMNTDTTKLDTTATSDASNSVTATNSAQTHGGLVIEDIKVGTGQEVKSGDTVVMQYKGTLLDGTKFDSSYDRGEAFTTQIGVGAVIKGWDQGVPGMKVGGKRKLTIPPELAYGESGVGAVIPPNSTLIFEVELVEIK